MMISKKYAKEVKKRLPKDADIIVAPAGSTLMASIKTEHKKVMINDATFIGLVDYHKSYTNLCHSSNKVGTILEKKALHNCDLLLFSSDWAANSAINDYNVAPSKVKVIPFGANIETMYSDSEINTIIKKRINSNKCNLLFVGVDWERKGGAFAVAVAKELYSQNIDVRLDIVGIKDIKIENTDYIINHGFISKKTDAGKQKLIKLFEDAHFFILPTMNEAFGIVFAEASSFALPSLAPKTGGVETAIKDNINGMTFELKASTKEYANYINNLLNNRLDYEKLCKTSFEYYKTELNWNIAGTRIVDAMRELIK